LIKTNKRRKKEKDAAAAADAEELNEDPTEPEVEIYLYNDGRINPLRSLTWHKFREMQHWLSKQDKKSDDEEDSSSDTDSDDSHHFGYAFFNQDNVHQSVFFWDNLTVCEWLRHTGFDEYEQMFADEGVDGPILTQLHHDDLKEFGMKLLRRKQFITALYELLSYSKWPTRGQAKEHHVGQAYGGYDQIVPLKDSPSVIEDEYMYFNYTKQDCRTPERTPRTRNTSLQMTGAHIPDSIEISPEASEILGKHDNVAEGEAWSVS